VELLAAIWKEKALVWLFVAVVFGAAGIYYAFNGSVTWRIADDIHPDRVRVIEFNGERCYNTLDPAIWRQIPCDPPDF
jgi:hypothetical protein